MSELRKYSLVGAEEIAARLGDSVQSVYRMARQGIIPHVNLGRRVKFDVDVVEAWIAAGGTALPGGWRKEAE